MLGISSAATNGIPALTMTQTGTVKDFDLANWIGTQIPWQIHCTIQSGAIYYADGSDFGVHPGWDTGAGWLTGSVLTIVNNGSVYGYRGGGASSGTAQCNSSCNYNAGNLADDGGHAFRFTLPTHFTNTGFIGPGGGGGGAGGHQIAVRTSDSRISFSGGGPGGEGAGYAGVNGQGSESTSNCANSFEGWFAADGSLTFGGKGGWGDNGGSSNTAYVYTDINGYDGDSDNFGGGGAAGGWFGRAGGTGGIAGSNSGFTINCINNAYRAGGSGGYSIDGYSNVFSYTNTGTVYGVTN